jgi:cysteine-rich repeat protein
LIAIGATGCIITTGDDAGFCGDRFLDPGESCDDGNNVSGDGCSATCGSESELGMITANWNFKSIASQPTTTCPPGAMDAQVNVQPVDAAGTNNGTLIVDIYPCSAATGIEVYPIGRYKVHIKFVQGATVFAETLPAYVDITANDQTYSATTVTDGGYFIFDWTLRGAVSGNNLTCAQAGNPFRVEMISTLSGPNTLTADQYPCEGPSNLSPLCGTVAKCGVTGVLAGGNYVVKIDAIDAAMGRLGDTPPQNTRIDIPNKVTDLNTVNVLIDNL